MTNSILASIGGNTSVCTGQNVTLTASGGSNYSWNSGETTSVITIAPTTSVSYTVIVSDGSCPPDTAIANLTVSNPPNLSITGGMVVCSGQSVTLTASGGGTYSWNTGSSASSIIVNPSSATNYTVTVNNGGCTASATQSVSVLPAITLSLTATATACTVNNGTATVNAGGGTSPFTYSWSDGQSAQTATGLTVGNYSATITDAAGCSITQSISVNSNSTLSVTTTATQTGCIADIGTATVAGSSGAAPYTYLWSNGNTTAQISNLAAQLYSVTITDANGCTASSTVAVTAAPGPSITASASTNTVTLGGSISLNSTGGGTYQWSPSTGLSCTTCSNPVSTPDQTTDYCVVVADTNGCSDSTCLTIFVNVHCGTVYILNAFSPNGDQENDLECVFGACIETLHLTIYNRLGELMFESSDQKICWDGTYRGKSLGDAVFSYHLEATLVDGTKVSRKGNVSLIR